MTHNERAELLLEASGQAERRLKAETPKTPAWIHAQRDAIRCRVDYWDQLRDAWDWDHRVSPNARRPG